MHEVIEQRAKWTQSLRFSGGWIPGIFGNAIKSREAFKVLDPKDKWQVDALCHL